MVQNQRKFILMEIWKKNSGSDYFGIGSISVSHCDKYLAYSIDLKGSEDFKIYLRDLGNGKNLEDVIEHKWKHHMVFR